MPRQPPDRRAKADAEGHRILHFQESPLSMFAREPPGARPKPGRTQGTFAEFAFSI